MSDGDWEFVDHLPTKDMEYAKIILYAANRCAMNGSKDIWNDPKAFNEFRASVQILEAMLHPMFNDDKFYKPAIKKLAKEKEETEYFYRRKLGLLMDVMNRQGMLIIRNIEVDA
jgi:hypothetical protein